MTYTKAKQFKISNSTDVVLWTAREWYVTSEGGVRVCDERGNENKKPSGGCGGIKSYCTVWPTVIAIEICAFEMIRGGM